MSHPRYARQITVPGVGVAGQHALGRARVLVIGAGGLGSPAALYLAAAGVGTIGIVDDDEVELSNLHRQILHTTADVGIEKTVSAAATVNALNPNVTVEMHPIRLDAGNAYEIISGYDIVIDGADNFDTRYLVSDATTVADIPHVWASVLTTGGQLSVFHGSRGPVYRDLLPSQPAPGAIPSCAEAGVLGVVPGILGVAQAGEALKLILDFGRPLIGAVLIYDMRTAGWERLPLRANPAVRRPATAAEVGFDLVPALNCTQLQEEVDALEVQGRPLVLVDVREPYETETGIIPGARLIPVGEFTEKPPADSEAVAELIDEAKSSDAEVVLYCKSGARSQAAARVLLQSGAQVKHLTGGIDAWYKHLDEGL